ncbi:hypothetical protein [Streptomyces eurythermus]|uniref:hypothetical protein n=1 Tax=Streptomyces eurythermus TaxID=42237 RepID=UPI0033E34126
MAPSRSSPRTAAYPTADGDLRRPLPARDGRAFRPGGALGRAPAPLLARPCADTAWAGRFAALDGLGRITPAAPPRGARPAPGRQDAGKPLAPPR